MSDSFEEKCAEIKKKFSSLSREERYTCLIEMGRALPPLPIEERNLEKRVEGCQSDLYLKAVEIEGKIFFQAYSEALISAGLAALLLHLYSGQSPETILLRPPSLLEDLQIGASLSFHRSNGLASLYLRMKQEALAILSKMACR